MQIVDLGRGPQLSTSRITVQDLVPYLQQGCSWEEVSRWLPSLTREEMAAAGAYYRANREECDEKDRLVRAHREEQSRQQQERFPWMQESLEARRKALADLLHRRHEGRNGEGNPR